MKLKLAFGIATAAMLFVGCGEDSVTNITEEAKKTGTITIKAIDSKTGLAVDSVQVYSLIDAKSSYTDTLGVTKWKDKVIGNYEYTLSKTGYATRTVTETLSEDSNGDVARVEDRITVVKMYKNGVAIKGTVLLEELNNKENKKAAANIPVVLTYDSAFVKPQEIKTITDSSGVYTFANLAEGLTYSITVPQANVAGLTYSAASKRNIVSKYRNGEQENLSPITMSIIGLEPVLIYDNTKTMDVNDSLVLTFSTLLNADSVTGKWNVTKTEDYSTVTVLTVAKLGADGKSIIIKPATGASWTKLATYTVNGKVWSLQGKELDISDKKFIPGSQKSKPATIQALLVKPATYNESFLEVAWADTNTSVEGYKVFYKTNLVADYQEYKNWSSTSIPTMADVCYGQTSYSNCDQYITKGTPNKTVAATKDVCSGKSSYSYCTQYAMYSTYPSETIPADSVVCRNTSSSNCDAYSYYGSPDKSIYQTTTESTIICGADENRYYSDGYYSDYSYCSNYPGRSPDNYTTDDYGRYTYYWNVEEDIYNYVWYTAYNYSWNTYNYTWLSNYVSTNPSVETKKAYLTISSIKTSDEITDVQVIVLPYVTMDGLVVTSDVSAATPTQYTFPAEPATIK